MTEKTTPIPKTAFRFIGEMSRPAKWFAIGASVVVLIAAALSQASAIVFKWMVDAIETGDVERVLWLGLLYPLAVFTIQILFRVSGVLGLSWAVATKKYIGDVLFSYTAQHSHTYFSNRFAGSLLNKVTNVISAVDSLIMDFLWNYLATSVSLLVTLYFIFSIDVLSGVIFLLLIFVLVVVNVFFVKQKRKLSLDAAASGSRLRGTMVDIFTNMTAVRQYSARVHEETTINELGEEWKRLGTKSFMHTERTLMINSLILFIFMSGVFYVMSIRWTTGSVTTGEFVFAVALFSQITGTLIFIGRAMTHYARIMGELEEGLDEIIVPIEIEDTRDALPLKISEGEIVFAETTFAYEGASVFKNFSLCIHPRTRIGLVGHSGAGKSTFVSLLLRQHDLTGGSIEIDDQDISEVTQDSLREAIAVVPQEPLLFHRSIRENIQYGKSGATEEEIIEAAKKAQAHEFISELPEGYETLVGERGVKLSGGQKQRVAIARAILKDAPILVLDEATSALDSESEVAIQKALETLMEGKTVIAVAHRLSTLRKMDRIIVLDRGQIVEDGDHTTLSNAGGTYQRLWEHQAGGFLTEGQ